MYLWLDLETTGLEPATDHILEVGWMVTDSKFVITQSVSSCVVTPNKHVWREIEDSPFIQDMHGKSGLLTDLSKEGTLVLGDIEDLVLEDIEKYQGHSEETVYLAGFGVHFDLNFIRIWMPRLADKLSYRILDVRSLVMFADVFLNTEHIPHGDSEHRAAGDILYSYDTMMSIAESLGE